MNKLNLHIRAATMAKKTNSNTQLYINNSQFSISSHPQHKYILLSYALSFPHTRIHVCALSYGFVTQVHVSEHIQEHILQPMEYTETNTCTLTYILMKVLVWGIPFQETKIIVKRNKQSKKNCSA